MIITLGTSQNPLKNPGLKEQTIVFAFLKIKIIHVSKLWGYMLYEEQNSQISKGPWIKRVKDYKGRRVWIWDEANLIHLCSLLSLAHMFMTHHYDSLLIH
jgi:hypothetical protein